MNILRFIPAVALMTCVIPAQAETVTVTAPGTLSQTVTDVNSSTLAVSGPVNAADLFWAGDNMTSLTALDLSGATIAAYSGEMLRNRSNYAAGTIPAAFNGSKLSSIVFPKDQKVTIDEGALASTALVSLDIPANVTVIGDGAFNACHSLKEVTIPAGTAVGAYAFASCSNLTTVNLGAGTADISEGEFQNCTRLATVNGTATLGVIGARAFNKCTALDKFTFGGDLSYIGECAFENSSLADVDLSAAKSLRYVGNWAFAHNDFLSMAQFDPESKPAVGKGIFFDCTELSAVTLPGTLKVLPDYILKGAAKAQPAQLEAIDSIGAYALKDNAAITALTLPSTLKHIGDGAMENMTGLQTIDATTLTEVPALGNEVWRGVNQSEVNLSVNSDAKDDFTAADQWKEFRLTGVTGVDDIIPDAPAAGGEKAIIRGRFIGNDLVLQSVGSPFSNIRVYDVAGRLVAALDTDMAEAVLDTSGADTQIFIVAAVLQDGTNGTLKIARR